ncbi:6633_t:CDS:2 [Funneliformis geosporum]|nr:6633_t:CDS:2 [Funneliformis geosporum]
MQSWLLSFQEQPFYPRLCLDECKPYVPMDSNYRKSFGKIGVVIEVDEGEVGTDGSAIEFISVIVEHSFFPNLNNDKYLIIL